MNDALLKFDRKKIRLPEKFRPAENFLARHAERFGFM